MKGILLINKPEDWTSHDVVAKMRGILREKRIGHGGTLDPMATGMLPLFVGRATRGVEFMEASDKEYIAGLRLGIVTDTQDTTGTVLAENEVNVSASELISVLMGLKGEQDQLPPMYSAVKVNGKKLYEYARAGKEIDRTPRRINIKELELLTDVGGDYRLRIVCTKGTYVRTICDEIGRLLGCGGAMSSLVRTRVGAFALGSAYTIEQVAALAETKEAEKLLLPIESLFNDLDKICLDKNDEAKCRNGVQIPVKNITPDRYRVVNEAGQFLMLGEVQPDGILKSIKSFFDIGN